MYVYATITEIAAANKDFMSVVPYACYNVHAGTRRHASCHTPPPPQRVLRCTHLLVLCLPVFLQLLDVVSQTRVVKAEVESALSRQFGGRRVNVLGEINNALAAGQGA